MQSVVVIPSGVPSIETWLVDLLKYPVEPEAGYLAPAEEEKAGRFRFEDDRRRYRAAHCALRDVIERRLGYAPGSLLFQEDRHGKPAIVSPSERNHGGLDVNLSHSGDQALIGLITDGRIGVDIETLRNLEGVRSLAQQNFTPQECEELGALPVREQSRAFLRCWTRKEACLKAVGCGLTVSPKCFYAGLSETHLTTLLKADNRASNVHVQTIDVGPKAIAAVAWIAPRKQAKHQPQ